MKRKTIDMIITATMVAFTIGIILIGASALSIAIEFHQFVQSTEHAWDAPWVNTITRGPIQ